MNIVTLDFEIHHKGDTDKRIAAATAHLQEHEHGSTQMKLATEYGVSQRVISLVVNNRSYI
jgi:trehalose utilization protein